MSKIMKCDECGKEIGEYIQYLEVIPQNTPSTFASPYIERQFCSWGCVVRYGKKQTGESNAD